MSVIYGIDCGSFIYSANTVSITASSSGSLISFSIDPINLSYDITFDSSLIGADGLTAEFSLEGKLASYTLT